MYYPDMSPYAYFPSKIDAHTVNIGWLDGAHHYPKGQTTEVFLDRLWSYCCSSIYLSFGYHDCDFCHKEFGVFVKRNGVKLTLGSAEIRVISKDGTVYAAPNMIYHYIVDHEYLPPSVFIQAVMESPLPKDSEDFQNRYGHL